MSCGEPKPSSEEAISTQVRGSPNSERKETTEAMPGISKQTTGRKNDKDYISLLPDRLIHHILSFLPTRDVVKTCVLSKSWRSVWTAIPDLTFSVSSYDDSFVDRVLTLYEWAKVKKFHLDIRSGYIPYFQIDSWVRFAKNHQVEELRLNYDIWCNYTLSPLVYSCSSLNKLCLSGCRLPFSGIISWSSLKSLSIQYMDVSDDELQKILMGSPILEYLNLKLCDGVKGIHSTSLKELVIEYNNGMQILTPRLLSLRVRTHAYFGTIRLVEAPPLLEAELDFYRPHKLDFCTLKEMLCKLQNATRILLGSWCTWVMGTRKVEDVQVSLPNCKSLTLHVSIHDFGFHGMANMLATTPNLEKLVIIFEPFDSYLEAHDFDSSDVDHESYWHIKKKFKRWARHLKIVEILVFWHGLRFKYEEVFTAGKFLLGHAFVLENMVIKVMNGTCYLLVVDSHELHEVAQRIQRYHRVSKHAVITLNYLEEEYGKLWKKGLRKTKKMYVHWP